MSPSSKLLRLLALLLALGLVAAACGGGDDGGSDSSNDDESSQSDDRSNDEDEDEPDDTTATTVVEEERDEAIDEFGDEVKDDIDPGTAGPATYGQYTTITDDSGTISVEVPVAWTDVDGRPGLFGPDVIASTDVQAWVQTYDVPGIEVQATGIETGQNTRQILTAVSRGQASQCTSLGRQPYRDPIYRGTSEVFQDCAGTDTDFVWLAFEPDDGSYHGIVGVQITTEADIEALERALATFVVTT